MLHTRQLAGVVEEGVAGYTYLGGLLYISEARVGRGPGRNSKHWFKEKHHASRARHYIKDTGRGWWWRRLLTQGVARIGTAQGLLEVYKRWVFL